MAFAEVEDVATRLARDLTAEEGAMAEMLLEAATAEIARAAGRDDAWAAALAPVPQILRFVAVELVRRAMSNPEGLKSVSETLGAYQHSRSFQGADTAGLFLTDREERMVRSAVYGTLSGSSRVESLADDLYGCS